MEPELRQQPSLEEKLQSRSEILADKINFSADPERRNQLIQKLVILFRNGFDENLFHQMDPKFFVEKGFSISEALLISKKDESLHPSIEEIQRLTKDNLTNILKLEYIQPNVESTLNYYYIMVIGPTNRGKTTVIFNLINSIYNINIDSLYRVKKTQGQSNEYYDEYIIQINEKECYVFVDFKGIGDVKLDFLGLDLSGKNNLFTKILQYVENKQILSILYVNSSSINRLGYEEHYQLQRFFEILPRSFLNRIFFILTYCTDNQPLLNVYSSELISSVPEEMKIMMRQPQTVQQENKFWFGINNAYLYEKIDYREQKEFKENNEIDIQAIIDGQQQYLNVEIQREEGTTLEQQNFQDNNQEDNQDIEIPIEELPKIYYNQMLLITKEIQQKLLRIQNSNPIMIQQNDSQTFTRMLLFEREIIKLLQIKNKQSKQEFPNRIIDGERKSVYLQYQTQKQDDKNNGENQKATKRGTKCLYCTACQEPCHETCYLKSFSEINGSQRKLCRKLIQNQKLSINPQNIDQSQYLQQILCKSCQKRGKDCTLDKHQLYDFIPIGSVAIIGKIETQINQEFDQLYFQKKLEKKILRIEQTSVFKSRRGYLSQVEKILKEYQFLNSQEDRLTTINLQKRTILINAIYKQLSNNQQEENSEYLTKLLDVKGIYNRIAPPPIDDITGQTQIFNSNQLKIQINDEEAIGEENKANEFDPPPESPLTFSKQGPQRDLSQYIANNNQRRFYQQQQEGNINQQNIDPSPSRRNITDNGSFVMHSAHEQSPLIMQRRDSVH